MKVKICGITNLDDALLAEKLGADALGFIFYEKSKRYISYKNAENIINKLSPFTIKVGVFVNEQPEKVNEIADKIKLSAIQLHGEEKPEEISKILYPKIKSFRINNDFNFTLLNEYKNASFLLDTFSEKENGGTGKTFNWNIIPQDLKNKIILAGGISNNNIEEIYMKIKPAAVDLSSSLESEPGKKDKEKVKEFFNKLNYIRSKNGYNDET